MTANELSAVAGIVLSLLFSYVPGFGSWYEPLPADQKRLLMIGFLVVVVLAVFGITCAGLMDLGFVCNTAGAFGLLKLFVMALVTNQTTYALSPQNTNQRRVWAFKYEARQIAKAKNTKR